MFWIVSGILGIFMVSLYFAFGSLGGSSSQFSEMEEIKTVEAQTFLGETLKCRNTMGYLRDYRVNSERPSIPIKEKVVVLSEKSIGNDLLEITVEGRLDGQHVTFWIREGIKDDLDTSLTTPFIFYLRGSGPYSDITKEESLLAGSEFSIVVPYIFGESNTISRFITDYDSSSVTFQTYVLAEITSIVDYITAVYDSPKIIIYGEAWGSVLGRELGLVDDRVDLVVSNKFSGDPNGSLLENGFSLGERNVNSVYLQESEKCIPRGVTNFFDLAPSPHIYLGPTIYSSLYSVGTKELAGLLEQKYLDLGLEDRFTYIELENLDHTYKKEVLDSIYESLSSSD